MLEIVFLLIMINDEPRYIATHSAAECMALADTAYPNQQAECLPEREMRARFPAAKEPQKVSL